MMAIEPHKGIRRFAQALVLSATVGSILVSCAQQAPAPMLGQSEAREVDAIARYLNNLSQLQANFIQSGDLGEGAGMIWLDRPGRLRIDYAGPQASVLVANGGKVVVFDRRSHSTTTMAVSRTPLGILLAPVITLSGDVTVLSFRHDRGRSQVTLQKTASPGQGTLTLSLQDHPLAISSVTLVDARGRTLVMALSDLKTAPVITPTLFADPTPAS